MGFQSPGLVSGHRSRLFLQFGVRASMAHVVGGTIPSLCPILDSFTRIPSKCFSHTGLALPSPNYYYYFILLVYSELSIFVPYLKPYPY